MADTKLTGLSALSGVIVPTDLLYVVDNPGGTPASVKATASQVVPEFVIHDATVSMATATVDINLPASVFTDYESLTARAMNVVPASPGTAPALFGMQIMVTGGGVSIDLASALELDGTEKCQLRAVMALGESTAGNVVHLQSWAGSTDGQNTGQFSYDAASADFSAGLTIRFLFLDSDAPAAAVNTTAGRFIVWGRKKP